MARRALLIAGAALTVAGCGGNATSAPPTTTTVVQLRQFAFLFPEGYTRAQMITRVGTDITIAKRKLRRSHAPARLAISSAGYAEASRRGVVPCFGKRPRADLEGFLFPAEYDFDVKTTASILEIGRAHV